MRAVVKLQISRPAFNWCRWHTEPHTRTRERKSRWVSREQNPYWSTERNISLFFCFFVLHTSKQFKSQDNNIYGVLEIVFANEIVYTIFFSLQIFFHSKIETLSIIQVHSRTKYRFTQERNTGTLKNELNYRCGSGIFKSGMKVLFVVDFFIVTYSLESFSFGVCSF